MMAASRPVASTAEARKQPTIGADEEHLLNDFGRPFAHWTGLAARATICVGTTPPSSVQPLYDVQSTDRHGRGAQHDPKCALRKPWLKKGTQVSTQQASQSAE